MNGSRWRRGLAAAGSALLLAGAPLSAAAEPTSPVDPASSTVPMSTVPMASVVEPASAAEPTSTADPGGVADPVDPAGLAAVAWPSLTQLTVSPNPARAGELVTFTAQVTSDTIALTAGTVTFADFNGARITVPLGSTGTASLTYAFDDPGLYPISATFDGTADFGASADTEDLGVDPVARAGGAGTFVVAQGGTLLLDATGSTGGGTIDWDLNGDGDFTDAAGSAPAVAWDQLTALGVDVGPARSITVRNTVNGRSGTGSARLVVTNSAPTVVVPGEQNAIAGQDFALVVGADDPSTLDAKAGFDYALDWGDGSVPETVAGSTDLRLTHRYGVAGTFTVSVTAADQHGGTGSGQVRVVVAVAAPAATATSPATSPATAPTTPTADPASTSAGTTASSATVVVAAAVIVRSSPVAATQPDGALAGTGGAVGPPLLLGGALVCAGAALCAAARPRRRAH